MTSGGLDFDYELLAEDAQDSLDVTGRGLVLRVEHAADRPFIRAGKCCELVAGESALPESERQCGLGRHTGRHGNATFAGPSCAWRRDVVFSLDSAGDRLLQGINRFGESFGFIGAGSQAFRQVAERDDDLARCDRAGDERGRRSARCVSSIHPLSKVIPAEAKLANHRGEQAGGKLLPPVLHDGEALTVV